MRLIRTLLLITFLALIAFLTLAFVTANQDIVAIDLLFLPTLKAKTSVWLLASFIVGAVVGLLVSSSLLLKARLTTNKLERHYKKNIDLLEKL